MTKETPPTFFTPTALSDRYTRTEGTVVSDRPPSAASDYAGFRPRRDTAQGLSTAGFYLGISRLAAWGPSI